MGCGVSRSSRTSPTFRSAKSETNTVPIHVGENDDWTFYAPRKVPPVVEKTFLVCKTCCHCGRRQAEPYSVNSNSKSSPYSWLGNSSMSFSGTSRSYSLLSTPTFSLTSSPCTDTTHRRHSPGSWLGNSTTDFSGTNRSDSLLSSSSHCTDTINARHSPGSWLGNSSTAFSGTSRSYSLLSTPKFSSTSSRCTDTTHSRHGLTLDPSLFYNTMSTGDTDRGSSPQLVLDPSLFSNNNSPFSDSSSRAVRKSKGDTDCGSRFSDTSRSLSFTSPPSSYDCFDKSYPLTPLSIHTEPFPRTNTSR